MSLGVDIEEVRRFGPLIKNKRFLEKVFTSQEIQYCQSKINSAQHFAVRFAAKEAVWKALSDLLKKNRSSLSHRDIGIQNTSTGKPVVTLPRGILKKKTIDVSLSHTKTHVVAVALLQ